MSYPAEEDVPVLNELIAAARQIADRALRGHKYSPERYRKALFNNIANQLKGINIRVERRGCDIDVVCYSPMTLKLIKEYAK